MYKFHLYSRTPNNSTHVDTVDEKDLVKFIVSIVNKGFIVIGISYREVDDNV